MNRDDIIRMAREAADVATDERGREFFEFDEYDLERFAALVAAHTAARIEMPYMYMTPYDIADMAKKAGFRIERWDTCFGSPVSGSYLELREFAALAAAQEREACARVAETAFPWEVDNEWETIETQRRTAERFAAAIRARGKE